LAKRVERMYADHGVDAEVINAGIGNYNTIQELEYFLTEGHKYHPDVIVLTISSMMLNRSNEYALPAYSLQAGSTRLYV